MLRLPESHRQRKRLLYAAVALGVLLALGLAQLVIGNDTPRLTKARPGRAQVYVVPKSVPATPEAKAAAVRTLTVFVRSAFIRRHLAESWPLATPHMKVGVPRAQWLHGDLPVVPYPAAQFRTASFTLRYSYRGVLGYDVLVLPKKWDGLQLVYACELHEVHGRWLVDFCYPRKTL